MKCLLDRDTWKLILVKLTKVVLSNLTMVSFNDPNCSSTISFYIFKAIRFQGLYTLKTQGEHWYRDL